MKLHTSHISAWKKVDQEQYTCVDTTVKSGLKIFAPTWEMVLGVKDGSMSEEAYTTLYLGMMRLTYRANKDQWLEIARDPKIQIFGCYCVKDQFCHRDLLTGIFKKICEKENIPFEYLGVLE